jgi:hypothetical protein
MPHSKTLLGEAARLTLLVLLYALFVIFLLVFVAIIAGPIPILWVWVAIVLIGGGGGFILFHRKMRVEGLKSNKPEDWVRAAGLLAIIFVLGQTLLALSSFYYQTVTQSRCIDPANVNVTSSNCKAIQTVSVPQANIFGNYGALILELAVAFVIVFVGLSGLLYILSRPSLRSPSSSGG